MHHTFLRAAALILLFFGNQACSYGQTNQVWQGIPDKKPVTTNLKLEAGKFNALRVFMSDEKTRISLKLSLKTEFGKTSYISKNEKHIDGRNGLEQTVDCLPQFPGDYELKISGKGASSTILIEQLADLEAVEFGEALGELVIENAGNSIIAANHERLEIKHPDFKASMQKGIATPDGKMLFKLPAGYWSLERQGSPQDSAQLIPVHSGKRTTIKWNVIPQINLESDAKTTLRRLDIRDAVAAENDVVTARFAFPAGLAKQTPTIEQMQVNERSLPAEIIDMSASKTPLHLVLLLDSSGSMKKDMKTAIDSAVKFLNKLPAEAIVEVIDFDTRAKLIKAKDRVELIKAVKAVKADGATALRDSVILGIDKLKSSPRPALVVFTDGFDANHNDTAPGSKASEKDVFNRVNGARVPIFTIGFGTGADEATLARLADISGGFYQAANSANLDEVFAALEETVAREYLLNYRRPQKAGTGIRPVVGIAIDTSGSMGEMIEPGKPGQKIEMGKLVLHSLVENLPQESLVQIIDYDSDTKILQTSTSSRARMHKGIANLDSGGGTDVLKALQVCLEGLLAVPSSRRYMLFLTDAAINQTGKNKQKFERMLDRIRDENIFPMWIGMVKDDAFAEVAKRSGGVSIISKNFAQLQETVNQLLAKIAEPVDNSKIPLEIIWQMPQTDAPPQPVSGAGLFELPPMKVATDTDKNEAQDTLQIRVDNIFSTQPDIRTADDQNSNTATSSSQEINSAAATSASTARMAIPIDIKAENSACRFHATRLELFNELNGVTAPKEKVFAAISLTLSNLLPEQDVAIYPNGSSHPSRWISKPDKDVKTVKATPPYQIQDLQKHMFLRWNSDTEMVSPVTWLLDDSLLPFNDFSITIKPNQPLQGKLVFMVSDKTGLSAGALDFFDTAYGNTSLIIGGSPDPLVQKVNNLPKKVGSKLGEAFNLTIDAVTDQPTPLFGATAGSHLVYRQIDLTIESQVQALLDLDASKRMHIELPTTAGTVRRPLSQATALMPGGFYNKVKLAPGSANHLRQAYLMPASLASIASGSLIVEMKGEDCVIKLNPDEQVISPEPAPWHSENSALKARINSIKRLNTLNKSGGNWLIIDATVADINDGSATRLSNLFFLGRADLKDKNFKTSARALKQIDNKAKNKGMGSFADNEEAAGAGLRILPDAINRKMLFAANDDAIVRDGHDLRFVTVFKLPKTGEYLLASDELGLQLDLETKNPAGDIPEWLLAINDEFIPGLSDAFEKNLANRLKQLAAAKRGRTDEEAQLPTTDENGTMSTPAAELSPPLIAPKATLPAEKKMTISVNIIARPIGDNAAIQVGKAASALGGGQAKERRFTLLSTTLSAEQLCKTPFELVYFQEPGESGNVETRIMASGLWGTTKGEKGIDLKAWEPVGEEIKFSSHGVSFPDFSREISGTDLEQRIHSVAAFIPNLEKEQAERLAAEWAKNKTEAAPNHLSIWRWFAHSRLASFIVDQTAFENTTAVSLGVSLSRENNPRLMVLTGGTSADGKFSAKLDLLAVLPRAEGEEEAARAFRITNGLFVSQLEAKIMQGQGVFEFWGRNQLQLIAPSGKQKNAWLKFAEKQGVSAGVLATIKKSKSVIMFPETPATLNDKPFWAWIEVDPQTYELIGVLETGERGTIACEAIIQALIPDGAGVAIGFWKGVETAIWGQCAFTVGGDSYEVALEKTEKLIGELGEHLGKIGESFGVPVGDAELDLLSGKLSLAGFSSDGTYSPWDGYKGFGTGFAKGAAYYLGKARAAGSR